MPSPSAPTSAAALSNASARPSMPTGSDSIGDIRARVDDTERTGLRATVFRPTREIPAGSKDGPSGPLSLPDAAYSVSATGRCAPRRAYLALCRGEQLERARRTDPPERRAFSYSRPLPI